MLRLFPHHAHAVGGDPLVLLLDQPLLTAGAEQLIKAGLGLEQLGLLNVEHGADLAVAVEPLLVSARQAGQAEAAIAPSRASRAKRAN